MKQLNTLRRILRNGLLGLSLLAFVPAQAVDDATAEAMINTMVKTWSKGEAIPFLTPVYGEIPVDRAYEIQGMLDKKLAARWGTPAGYKVGYASLAAQKQFGMSEPARGTLFLSRRTPNASHISSDSFMESMLETEVAFTIKDRIRQPVADVEALKKHVQWVHASFDGSDFRFKKDGTKGGVSDMVASGVGGHYYVLGPGMDPAKVDVDSLTLNLARNGEHIASSPATDVMGSPWNSLLWCVNDVIKRGGIIKPGTVVLTGTAFPAFRASGDDLKGFYEGDCGELGKVILYID